MATIKDVARLAGVSVSTVSRVINDNGYVNAETRKNVINAMENLGFRPSNIARGLVSGKTYTIGLVIPDISNPFFPDIARGVEDEAIANNYNVILCNSDWKVERETMYLSLLIEKRCEGVVLVGSHSEESDLLKVIGKMPFVSVDREMVHAGHSVWVDNEFGAYTATKHLYEEGYKRVVHISGPPSVRSANARLSGYKKAVREFNYHEPQIIESDFRTSGGYESALKVLEQQGDSRPDAIFAGNDLMAIGVIQACEKIGIKGGVDLGIVGFDGIGSSAYTSPSLTTIFQPGYEMGRRACHLLLDEIVNPGKRRIKEVFNFELLVRASTKWIK
ncbi:LacI family DNA-binding transcriptional regulator [Neobacillus fumarioli]|uniref:LacI family DNA-binding transcriptional regulator n=1 Tax=Neobacillus fumarioli TaxID=105229 RepID=UPI00082A159A|nr:LacI family DNA-binding transcriptional regulator [Neobacillus fumarioli]